MTEPLSIEVNTSEVQRFPTVPDHPKRLLLRPLTQPGQYLLVLDNSSLEVFTTCNRAAEFKLVLAREAHAKNAALVFGGAVHEGLEALYRGATVDEQNQKVIDFFSNNPPPPDEFRTVGNALQVLKAYRAKCDIDPGYSDKTLEEWNEDLQAVTSLIERPFELPLTVLDIDRPVSLPQWPNPKHVSQIHVAYSGRIDRVAFCHNANRIMDHKTGAIVDPEEYQIAAQPIGYVWAGQQLWPELNITGFCLNGLQLKKNNLADITGKGPRGGVEPLTLFRAYFDYEPAVITRWHVNTINLISDFVNDILRNYHPMKTKWCKGKYGKCPYWDVCTLPDDTTQRRYLQSEVFKDVTWDPVAGR